MLLVGISAPHSGIRLKAADAASAMAGGNLLCDDTFHYFYLISREERQGQPMQHCRQQESHVTCRMKLQIGRACYAVWGMLPQALGCPDRLHHAVRLNHAIHRSYQDRALSVEILPEMEFRLLKVLLAAFVVEATGAAHSLNPLLSASDVANLGETEIESAADALHPLRNVEALTGDQHRLWSSGSARNFQLQNYSAIQEGGALAARTTYLSVAQDF